MEKNKRYNLPAKTDDWVDNFITLMDNCIDACERGKKNASPEKKETWCCIIQAYKFCKNRVMKGNLMGIEEKISV
jgi:endonuclease YncB( thermonuclease family)